MTRQYIGLSCSGGLVQRSYLQRIYDYNIFVNKYKTMGGGLMQLVAYGAQDIYLSGNPQITFFKVVYRRHTNFSMESIQQTFNGDVGFDKKVTCTISRNGDLISKMYLEIDLEPLPDTITNEISVASHPNIFNEDYGYKDGTFSKPSVLDLSKGFTVKIPDLFTGVEISTDINDLKDISVIGSETDAGEYDGIVTVFGSYQWTYPYENGVITDVISGGSISPTTLENPPYTFTDNDNGTATIDKMDYYLVYNDTDETEISYNAFRDNEILHRIYESEFKIVEVASPIDTTPVQIESVSPETEVHDVYRIDDRHVRVTYVIQTTPPTPSIPTQEWIGHKIIDYVEVEIGGQRIDKHYGDWLAIWNELTQTEGHWDGYKQMVEGSKLYIPLQFWFNRNPGLALPLIALQYHEVKLNIKFASKQNTYTNLPTTVTDWMDLFDGVGDMKSASLYVDYVYLDTDERRRFAQVSHEYLIEQLQFTGDENVKNKIKLNFNHPVKELVWVEKLNGDQPTGEFATSYSKATLQLNGHDRFSVREASYFQLVQPYQHHTRTPVHQDINVYSFSMKPEEHQPSGSCNMSRIDNATLYLENASNGNTIKVFAINYNVLRVMSGMGGLAYSN